MNFTLEDVDGISILHLDEDRLDSNISTELKAQLLVLTNQENCEVIIDLSKTAYADSSGLGALLLGVRQARDNGGICAISGAQKRVKSLINIAHLDEILVNYEDAASAIEMIKERRIESES